jgi:lipooligosaccharide transport system permease protein
MVACATEPLKKAADVSARTLPLRITPQFLMGRHNVRYVIERNLLVYKHIWLVIFSGFIETLVYLFAVRIGIGTLVDDIPLASGGSVDYATFAAPGLLAAAAMNGAVFESTMNIYFKLKFAKTYDAMLATPMEPFDLAIGEIGWSQIRGSIYAVGYMIVLLAMGLVESPWSVLALPSAILIGFAFGAVGMAATTYMRSWQDFELVNLVVLVLFLFSATFYPVSVYPDWLQVVAHLSPLYHGVALIRGLMLGDVGLFMLGHVAFLAAMGAAGLAVVKRRLVVLLTP